MIDSLLSLSPSGVLKLSTPDATVSVRLDRIGMQVVAALCEATFGGPNTKTLRLASHAECLPVESWPPVVKRVRPKVRVVRLGR